MNINSWIKNTIHIINKDWIQNINLKLNFVWYDQNNQMIQNNINSIIFNYIEIIISTISEYTIFILIASIIYIIKQVAGFEFFYIKILFYLLFRIYFILK